MENASEPFRAYPSKKQALVTIATFAPLLTLGAWPNVVISNDPLWIRFMFGVMIGMFALILVGPVRSLVIKGPMLEVSAQGFRWRGWSSDVIPWSAVRRWKLTSHLGIRYVTIWLREPRDHRATTAARWTQHLNGWLGQGHISIPEGGLACRFEEIAAAFGRLAPQAPLPSDPRLARRLLRARQRRRGGA